MRPNTGVSLPVMLLISLILAITILLALIVLTLLKARNTREVTPNAENQPDQDLTSPAAWRVPAKDMLLSFSRGLTFLKQHVAGRDYRYEVPWLLMMGSQGVGTTSVLRNAGASASLSHLGGPTFGVPGGLEWWFYDRGVVLNAPGEIVLRSGGQVPEKSAWYALLQSLLRRRARRPLDAVILAISVEDFLRTRETNAPPSDLAFRAEVLRQRLADLRRILALRMPIYILVTKCDLVPGFASFAKELSPLLNQEIFGWSNPYPLQAAFSPDWVEECVSEMGKRIIEQQMEIFAERDHLQEPDAVFLFPAEFESLRTPLRQYLSVIFQSTAYQESYYFRGIYFCGDAAASDEGMVKSAEPIAAPGAVGCSGVGGEVTQELALLEISPVRESVQVMPLTAGERERQPVFLNHLFERKIFPESFLARPLSVIHMSRNRTVLAVKFATAVFLLIATFGTLTGYIRLSNLKHQHLGPLFRELGDDLARDDSEQARLGRETPPERNARLLRASRDANDVLGSMALLSQRRLQSVFLPSSWNGDADRNAQAALAKVFGGIVLKGLRIDLTLRLANLIRETTPRLPGISANSNAAPGDVVSEPPSEEPVFELFADVPEYQAWEKYVFGLKELDRNIARYNRIATPGGGTAHDLKQLLKYLQMDLPPELDLNNPYFVRMLQQGRNQQFSYDGGDSQAAGAVDAVKHAHALIEGFFTAWFGANNRLAFDVNQMVEEINRFPAKGSQVNYEVLKSIAESIRRVLIDLNSPAFTWLSEDKFDVRQFPAFDQPVSDLQYLQGLRYSGELADYGERGFGQFCADLATNSTRLTGSVLDMENAPVQATSSVVMLEASLRVLLDQAFVAREPGPDRRIEAERPIWDRNLLLEAKKLFDDYERYERNSLRTVPPSLREALQRVALQRLQDNVLDYIHDAQSMVAPGSPDGVNIQSFNQSVDILQQLLADFAKFPEPQAARNFSSVLTAQASQPLVVLENDLKGKNLYTVKDQNFDWWGGEKPLSLAAYDVRTADDLKEYVDHEREQVNSLSEQAEPLVKFLQSRTSVLTRHQANALTLWRAVSQELKKYNDKTPQNSVLVLEDFIRTGLDKIAPDLGCQDNTKDSADREDFFLLQRRSLRKAALARCRVLSERTYTTQIASLFNPRLAGRFPFAAAGPQGSLSELDPESLLEFFSKFDQYGKIAADSLNQNSQLGKSRDAALGFLSQITAIRPVFASLLAKSDKDPILGFDIAVKFGVNRNKEIEGNQIIDWSLDVGRHNIEYQAKEKTGHWDLGDPIKITLRFADDSPSVPVKDDSQSAMNVHQRTVTFEYTDAWSLFRLLLEHKPSSVEFSQGVDPTPHTLSFYIATIPDRRLPQPKGGAAGQVRIYMQIDIVPAGMKNSVTVPLPFPMQAPSLTQQ
ncbi:MAG: hypothetical protein JO323_16130 [Acidobacteriia bacterium]|nr:hypothetical protein [Terriglobia bacterium]